MRWEDRIQGRGHGIGIEFRSRFGFLGCSMNVSGFDVPWLGLDAGVFLFPLIFQIKLLGFLVLSCSAIDILLCIHPRCCMRIIVLYCISRISPDESGFRRHDIFWGVVLAGGFSSKNVVFYDGLNCRNQRFYAQ